MPGSLSCGLQEFRDYHKDILNRSTEAQMAERAAMNLEVPSSSPRPGSIMRSCFKKSNLFDVTLVAEGMVCEPLIGSGFRA